MASKTDYFKLFKETADVSMRAVERLNEFLNNFHADTLQAQLDEMHQIESEGDRYKHLIFEKISKDFITPIEREDILSLADQLDDVTDCVEDVLIKLYMYNIQSIEPAALEFIKIIRTCCQLLCEIMHDLPNFRKSKTIMDRIIEINRLEEVGDRLYIDTVHALYTQGGSALDVIAWTRVYDSFERCCDICEHTADVVRSVIMKNT